VIQLSKTLRIWISNTVEDQAWQGSGDLNVDAFDFSPNMEASYRVKIEGRLLDDDYDVQTDQNSEEDHDKMDEDGATTINSKTPAKAKKTYFSQFFQGISVDFDKQRFRNGAEQPVEWKRPESNARAQPGASQSPDAEFDEFTFKRNGDENMNVSINLFRFEVPERYQFSPDLAEVVDLNEGTPQEAVMGLWEYIRLNGLQEDEEKRNFRCDELLRRVRCSHCSCLTDLY
jgi:chromatin remodeling complex protein RSC6